jgi:hypothetical protein
MQRTIDNSHDVVAAIGFSIPILLAFKSTGIPATKLDDVIHKLNIPPRFVEIVRKQVLSAVV